MYIPNVSAMIKSQSIESMVQAYDGIISDFDQIDKLLKQCVDRAGVVFDSSFHVLGAANLYGFSAEKGKAELLKRSWRYVINQTGINEVLTQKRRNQIDKQIENGEMPPFDVVNIMGLLQDLRGNTGEYFQEAVEEVFSYLRPHDHYKTNDVWQIGKKVILEYMVCCRWNPMLEYSKENILLSLDNVMHLLDGRGTVKYPGTMTAAIRDAIKHGQWSCETDYFKIKWFKKGTMHIEFKRLDLVKEVNRIAGGANVLNKAS